MSGLGKGVTASSIGVVLKACGLRVTTIKIGSHSFPSSPPAARSLDDFVSFWAGAGFGVSARKEKNCRLPAENPEKGRIFRWKGSDFKPGLRDLVVPSLGWVSPGPDTPFLSFRLCSKCCLGQRKQHFPDAAELSGRGVRRPRGNPSSECAWLFVCSWPS